MPCFREPLKLKCADNSLWGIDFMVHAMKCILVPIFILLDKSILTAADGFKRFEPRGEVARTKPLRIKLWICIRFENKLARGIEFSRDKEFLLARFHGNVRF